MIETKVLALKGKFLVAEFEFEGSLDMSLEGDCHELEVTPNLELLVIFGMKLEGVSHELDKLVSNLEK
jgi:hypothetical protein